MSSLCCSESACPHQFPPLFYLHSVNGGERHAGVSLILKHIGFRKCYCVHVNLRDVRMVLIKAWSLEYIVFTRKSPFMHSKCSIRYFYFMYTEDVVRPRVGPASALCQRLLLQSVSASVPGLESQTTLFSWCPLPTLALRGGI